MDIFHEFFGAKPNFRRRKRAKKLPFLVMMPCFLNENLRKFMQLSEILEKGRKGLDFF